MVAMKLTVDAQTIPCQAKEIGGFDEVWKQVTKEIYNGGKLIHHVVIDGQLFYGGYEEHIINKFKQIDSIDITTISREEARDESLKEVYAYNRRLIAATDEISAAFYGEPTSEQWTYFAQFLEGLQWLSQSLHFIQTLIEDQSEYDALQQQIGAINTLLSEKVVMLDGASKDKDFTLMGDIIQYELSEVFDKIDQELGGTV